eukprot:TRINITY_DN468_c0_g1_i1.p1 TRINITY_DN468_c0_g1~~TRINITY_DN468_c0_g1_i1.p1  ORF type:complete len:196 (+),score=48.56 TRINITY_DN468_c0_g1_i1:77-589(+)
MKKTKKHIGGLLKKVFQKKAPDRISEIDDMLDDFIARGIGMRNGYEMMCEMYDIVPEKVESRRATRGLSINKAAHDENRRKQAMWVENAQVLSTKLNAKMSNLEDELLEHEEEFFNVKDVADEDHHADGVIISPGVHDEDFEHIAEDIHHRVVFEDVDLSQEPEFWKKIE